MIDPVPVLLDAFLSQLSAKLGVPASMLLGLAEPAADAKVYYTYVNSLQREYEYDLLIICANVCIYRWICAPVRAREDLA